VTPPSIERARAQRERFNLRLELPFELRVQDFELALQDVYDFFHDVNLLLAGKGLRRLDDTLRPAGLTGLLSDMLTASLAKHSRALVQNAHFNGYPDLVVQGVYPGNAVQAGSEGVEIKTTRKPGGAVDTHGPREGWQAVFVYEVDNATEPAVARRPLVFTEIYLARVGVEDFRKNARSELGTRTATLDRRGLAKLRANWLYRLRPDAQLTLVQ
jgi:hypothetical protein